MRLTITEKHLDLGIEAIKTGVQTRNCVLAQAAKEVIPNFISCTNAYIHTESDPRNWRLVPISEHVDILKELVNSFDALRYETTRSMLPVEIEFVPVNYESCLVRR